MSGGSYEYLCYKDWNELNQYRQQINEMRDRLTELGYLDAAKETESILLTIDAFEVRIEARLTRLRDIWQAVEWCDSGDWGEDSILEEIKKYRGE